MRKADNKPGGEVVSKRGNRSKNSVIGKDWSKLKIGYQKVLLDQQAKKDLVHVTKSDPIKNSTTKHTYSNRVSEKLMSLAYRTSGSINPLAYNLTAKPTYTYSLNENGKLRLDRKRREQKEKGD